MKNNSWGRVLSALKRDFPRYIKWAELQRSTGLDRRTVESAVKSMWANRLLAFWKPHAEDDQMPSYCEVCGRTDSK